MSHLIKDKIDIKAELYNRYNTIYKYVTTTEIKEFDVTGIVTAKLFYMRNSGLVDLYINIDGNELYFIDLTFIKFFKIKYNLISKIINIIQYKNNSKKVDNMVLGSIFTFFRLNST